MSNKHYIEYTNQTGVHLEAYEEASTAIQRYEDLAGQDVKVKLYTSEEIHIEARRSNKTLASSATK